MGSVAASARICADKVKSAKKEKRMGSHVSRREPVTLPINSRGRSSSLRSKRYISIRPVNWK